MSIQERPRRDGKVSYQVRLRRPDGTWYSKTFRTKREAKDFIGTERTSQLSGSWIDPLAGGVTLSEYAQAWLRLRPSLRPRTLEQYEYLLRLRILPHLGHVSIRDLTTAGIRRWHSEQIAKHGSSASTAAKAYRLLRTILTTAVDDELIPRNPCRIKSAGIERPEERPILTLEQVRELADVIEPRYRAMVLLAVWTGIRYGEAAALCRANIALDVGTIRIERQLQELNDASVFLGPPKTAAGRRTVAMPPHVIPEIALHLGKYVGHSQDAVVFTSPEGAVLRRSNFNRRVWRPTCSQLGLDAFRFHDLRHTGNTLAASTGASTKELMARMGHASPRAALIYQHATPDRDRTIAAQLSRIEDGQV
jgi:integrase